MTYFCVDVHLNLAKSQGKKSCDLLFPSVDYKHSLCYFFWCFNSCVKSPMTFLFECYIWNTEVALLSLNNYFHDSNLCHEFTWNTIQNICIVRITYSPVTHPFSVYNFLHTSRVCSEIERNVRVYVVNCMFMDIAVGSPGSPLCGPNALWGFEVEFVLNHSSKIIWLKCIILLISDINANLPEVVTMWIGIIMSSTN